MFGSIRKLMSNVMPKRPAPRPPPAQPTGWSDRSGFTPSVRAARRPDFNPPSLTPPEVSSRPGRSGAAERASGAAEVSTPSPEEVAKLVADWLKEKAYDAGEVLAVLTKEIPDTEREKKIAFDAGVFQRQHGIPEHMMVEALGFHDARRHTNDGDPVLLHDPSGG